jgi:SAM-dependent methyltransferase
MEPVEARVILNLGCGRDRSVANAVTIDKSSETRPDVVHDLDTYPWPFADNRFDEIHCKDVIEHLGDIVKATEEIWRIGKPGARVQITTPHFSCYNSYLDPTHRHHLSYLTFDMFTQENEKTFFTAARFKKVSSSLVFHMNLKNKLISRLANRYPEFYERHLCWVFPAWFIMIELEVIKPSSGRWDSQPVD